jgi:hypothetical protein
MRDETANDQLMSSPRGAYGFQHAFSLQVIRTRRHLIDPWVVVFCLFATTAAHAEKRVAIIVGTNVGAPDDTPLRFAERDAKRVRDVLVELGGVSKPHAFLRLGSRVQIDALLRSVSKLVSQMRRRNEQVLLFFYYSGHGDEASLHLPSGNLSLRTLTKALDAIPASLRIVMLDSCRTAQLTKGIRRTAPFQLAIRSVSTKGTIELRASAAGEPAQESFQLGGAVFTNYLIAGLRGAADYDGDRQVTLSEAYAYVQRHTLARSLRSRMLQHPSLVMKTVGKGQVVLANLAKAAVTVSLPGGAERYFILNERTSTVVAQLDGRQAVRVALPRGRFVIVRRVGSQTGQAIVDLSLGGKRQLTMASFRRVAARIGVSRGGAFYERHRFGAGVASELCFGCAESAAIRAGIEYRYLFRRLVLSAHLAYGGSRMQTSNFGGENHAVIATAPVDVTLDRDAPIRW